MDKEKENSLRTQWQFYIYMYSNIRIAYILRHREVKPR